ncbi:MAG: PIN domain-containing protein [Thermoplasmata archaeon]|nr:PIN domain-containing protein [Thermoplasmata archaeon]
MKRYLFDTKALMAFFNEEKGADDVGFLLAEVDNQTAEGYISAITLTEIYYLYAHRFDENTAKKRVTALRVSNLKTVVIDDNIAVDAGRYKARKSIPVADALIAACASATGSHLVTDDKHFESAGIRTIRFR